MLLQKPMDCRPRQTAPRYLAACLQQLPELPNRAPGIIALGGDDRFLDRRRDLGLAAIGSRLRHQAGDAMLSPLIKPSLDGLLTEVMAA